MLRVQLVIALVKQQKNQIVICIKVNSNKRIVMRLFVRSIIYLVNLTCFAPMRSNHKPVNISPNAAGFLM